MAHWRVRRLGLWLKAYLSVGKQLLYVVELQIITSYYFNQEQCPSVFQTSPFSFKGSTQYSVHKSKKCILVCRFSTQLQWRLKPQASCVPTLHSSVWIWGSSDWGRSWHHRAPDAGGKRCSSRVHSKPWWHLFSQIISDVRCAKWSNVS